MKIITKEFIEKGWSEDKKYCITTADHHRYLLRVSPSHLHEKKTKEFEIMKKVSALGIPMCQPIQLHISEEAVYSIHSWIDGTDAELTIPTLSLEKQFSYGFTAGQILKKIHEIPSPSNIIDWEDRFSKKAYRKIQMYENCPLKYENGQLFIDYIHTHLNLLKGRPSTFQHGDYHIGNMMINSNKELVILDFNRFDYGDPWEEFNRIVWCAQKAPAFAKGMIDGYFNYTVPSEFWELLALYISSNTLGSLSWSINFGEDQIRIISQQAEEILGWYHNLKDLIPSWYKSDIK